MLSVSCWWKILVVGQLTLFLYVFCIQGRGTQIHTFALDASVGDETKLD